MDRVAFVEILDRRGRVRERVRLRGFPATVGRGYESDVIVEDRHVSPLHCRLVQDEATGAVSVEDLDSLNGLAAPGSADAVRRLDLVSGDRFRLGETTLRYVESGHPVAPAEPLVRDSGGVLDALRRRGPALGAVAGTMGFVLFEITANDYGETDVLGDALLAFIALAGWAGGWAFVNRLLTHRFDYLRHLAWAGLVTLGFGALASVVNYVRFLFSADDLATLLEIAGGAGGFGVLLSGHLAIVPASTRRLRRRWALASSALLAGIVLAFAATDEGFVGELPFEMPLESFGADWGPTDTVDDMLDRARETKRAVDALREPG